MTQKNKHISNDAALSQHKARVFITGSADGLGRMAAQLLVEQGHTPVLHARNEQRGREAMTAAPGAETVVIGDLSSIAQMKEVAAKVNALGHFDAVIHNAGVGYQSPRRVATEDGLPLEFAVNTLAPYVLTALIHRPKRLVYLSSGLRPRGVTIKFTRMAIRVSKISRGRSVSGEEYRLTPTPSCTMSCLPSQSRADGRIHFRMGWSQAGWLRRWAARPRPMT